MKGKKDYRHHQPGPKKPSITVKDSKTELLQYYVSLSIILLLSFIIYLPVFKNGFVWDDELYIINNKLIRDLSWKGIRAIFYNFSSDNYAPVTDLIYAVQYRISGLNPAAFHLGSLVFHLINTTLVFWFIKLLSNSPGMAVMTALFFGIHPMQVESVAWASGGSTLYCAAFFSASLIAYLYYLDQKRKRYLILSLMFFLISLLTKAVAVVLPVVIFLLDYYRDRKVNIKLLLEKSPFFLLSLGAGILTLMLKYQVVSIENVSALSFPQRIIFAFDGFVTYLLKLLFPVNLSAYYPYPVSNGVPIPLLYYSYLILFSGIVALAFYSLGFTRKIFFGIGFFAVTIFLLLQIIPVGNAFMADRYVYIPSIGIFFMAAAGINALYGKKQKLPVILIVSVFTLFFSVKTYARCAVWENNLTLWNNVIDEYKTVAIAYYNRGNLFMNDKRNDEAIRDFNKAIELDPGYAMAYNNRGTLLMGENRIDEALNDFNRSIGLEPGYANVYYNRGNLFMKEKRYDEAILDFNKAIDLDPGFAEPYITRGILFKNAKRINDALNDFNKAIELKPGYAIVYYNRGTLFMSEKRPDDAMNDFNKAVELDPGYVKAYYNLGVLLLNKKRYEEAIRNFTNVIALKSDHADAYYNRGLAEFYSDMKDAACADLRYAAGLGSKQAADALPRICK